MATTMDLERMLEWEDTNATESQFHIYRARLNLDTKEVKVEEWENLQEISFINTFDFPMINYNYAGRKHRYVYGWAQLDYYREPLIKKDLQDSNNDLVWFQKSQYPGEMFFIPNPEGVEEDDGVLVTVVFDGNARQSYLLLLDAANMQEINRAYLPHVVPFAVHGNWFPNLV